MPMHPPLRELLQKRNYAAVIKILDAQLAETTKPENKDKIPTIKLSRSHAYHQIGLYRKALKVKNRL